MDTAGSSALVTGGASGLGRATARRLAASGATVTIVDLPGSAGEEVAADLGGRFAPADVTDPEQIAAAVALAAETGPLRVVVNCEIGRAHVELQSLMRSSYAVLCLKKKK